jgi:hypothetical protein
MSGEELSKFIDKQVEQLKAIAEHLGLNEVFRQGVAVFVRFRPAREERIYAMRCLFHENVNPAIASISFVNPETLTDEGGKNWPIDRSGALKTTNNPPFICIPGVYEYHYQFHTGTPVMRQHLDLVNVVSDIIGLLSK